MSRVVVVGAGLGGLAVAARLARMRHDVVVVERADAVGGRLRGWTYDGTTVEPDPGPILLPAALRDLFLKTGDPLESVLTLAQVDPTVSYRYADGTRVDLPAGGPGDVAAAFSEAFGARAGADWLRFFHHVSCLWELARGPLVEAVAPTRSERARLGLRHPRRLQLGRSATTAGRRFFSDPHQRALLECFGDHVRTAPAPAVAAVTAYVEHTFRVWALGGAGPRLVEVLARRVTQRGATIRTGVEAVGLRVDAERVTGVHTSDGSLDADVVVTDVDVRVVYDTLLGRSRPGEVRDNRTSELLLLVRGGADTSAPPARIVVPRMTAKELGPVVMWRPPASDDRTPWSVRVPVPAHGVVDWRDGAVAADFTQRVLKRLAEVRVDVGVDVTVVARRTPADLEEITGAPGGSRPGWATGVTGLRHPPNAATQVSGLFHVGGSVHPGPGMAEVLMSGAIVADLVGRGDQRARKVSP